jgi:hypothetical protein
MPWPLHVLYLVLLVGLIVIPFFQQPILTAAGLAILVIGLVVYFLFVRRPKLRWCLRLDGACTLLTVQCI